MYTMIVGAYSDLAKEYVKENRQEKFILLDLENNGIFLREFTEYLNLDALVYELDVRNIMDIELLFIKLKHDNIVITKLIYFAGVNYLADATEISEQIWDDILSINLKGCFFIMKEVGKNMIYNSTKGSMVNVASQHGIVGNYKRVPYCASKAGLINMNRALALEWADYGIRVNAISPTQILYDKNKELLMSSKFKNEFLRNIPLKRYCSPKDIVNAIHFLLSPISEMITGHNLVIDGGWTIK